MLSVVVAACKVVAPYVGAWIETVCSIILLRQNIVAPYVGAWIETIHRSTIQLNGKSHPTWVRGLKPYFHLQ